MSLPLGGPHLPECECVVCVRLRRAAEELWDRVIKEVAMEGAVIVAKMFLNTISRCLQPGGTAESEVVKLGAVYGDKGTANAQWSKWTPSGHLELNINNPDAIGKVKAGYYKVYLVPCDEND